jgi:hypothetical protein
MFRNRAPSSRTSVGLPARLTFGKYSPFQWSIATLLTQLVPPVQR